MNLVNAILIYILIWWVTLFAILPIGVRGQAEENNVVPGSEPGAPVRSHMTKKFIQTTIVSLIIFAIVYVIITNDLFGIAAQS